MVAAVKDVRSKGAVAMPRRYSADLESARPVWTFEYDALNLLVREIDPRGHDTRYDYDERLKLDLLNRMRVETWVRSGVGTLEYNYDLADRLIGTNDDWSDYVFDYDDLNRLKSVTADLPALSVYIARFHPSLVSLKGVVV